MTSQRPHNDLTMTSQQSLHHDSKQGESYSMLFFRSLSHLLSRKLLAEAAGPNGGEPSPTHLGHVSPEKPADGAKCAGKYPRLNRETIEPKKGGSF